MQEVRGHNSYQGDGNRIRFSAPTVLNASPKSVFRIFFGVGVVLAALEILIAPHPHHATNVGSFPAFQFAGATMTLAELYIVSGIGLFAVFLLGAVFLVPQRSVVFGVAPSRGMNILAFVFMVNMIFASALGLVLANENLLTFVRVNILLFLIVLFYRYRKVVYHWRRYVTGLMSVIGVFYASNVVLEFLGHPLPLPSFMIYEGMWFGLYFTAFALIFSLSRLLIERMSVLHLFVVLFTLLSITIRITNKPIILVVFVGVLVVGTVALTISKRSRWKLLGVSVVASAALVSMFNYSDYEGQFYSTFAERFYKIQVTENTASEMNLFELLGMMRKIELGGGNDVTAGRAAIWSSYFGGGLQYPLVSPRFGAQKPITQRNDRKIRRSAHNSIAYYAYHVGYIAAMALIVLMIWFVVLGWKRIMRVRKAGEAEYVSEFVGLYAFVVSIMAVEMVGGPLLSSVTFTWFFFSVVVVVLFKIERVTRRGTVKNDCINSASWCSD